MATPKWEKSLVIPNGLKLVTQGKQGNVFPSVEVEQWYWMIYNADDGSIMTFGWEKTQAEAKQKVESHLLGDQS